MISHRSSSIGDIAKHGFCYSDIIIIITYYIYIVFAKGIIEFLNFCWLSFACWLLFIRLLAVIHSFAGCYSFVCWLLFIHLLAVIHSFAGCYSFVCWLLFIHCWMYIHSLLTVIYVQMACTFSLECVVKTNAPLLCSKGCIHNS